MPIKHFLGCKKDFIKNSFIYVFSFFISAICFTLFLAPYNIVTGGTSGLAIIVNQIFNINEALFILVASVLLIIIGFIFLHKKETIKCILGALLFPIFTSITTNITSIIDLSNISPLLICIFAGVLDGVSSGFLIRKNYSGGSTYILYRLMNKYMKISLGRAILIANFIIIGGSIFIIGFSNALYGVICLYISSIITDKIALGISDSKCFIIISKRYQTINEFIITNLNHNSTIINVKGGFNLSNDRAIFCVISTREYYRFKTVISKIDPQAFFLITDTYQIQGGM